jgi:hypothetical protein
LQSSSSGAYSVLVSNAYGTSSSTSSLSVFPTIVTAPLQSQTTFPWGSVAFTLGLQAVIPVSFQWQHNGVNIDGATNATLSLTNVNFGQGGTYTLIYSDSFETVTNSATLTVVPVAAWGFRQSQSSVPAGLTNLLAVVCGFSHALSLDVNGNIAGWGGSVSGETVPPPGLTNVIAISAGEHFSVALKADGTVMQWGANYSGQTNLPSDLSNVVAIASSFFHSLALRSDGTVVAWGANSYGQVTVPPGLSNVVAIAAGEFNSMALKSDGTVAAWGAGTNNTGNAPNFGQSIVPAGLSNCVQIATGSDYDLALLGPSAMTGWGGSTGIGGYPLPGGVTNVASISAGYDVTLVLRADRTVIALGSLSSAATLPVGLTNVFSISAGDDGALALVGSGPPSWTIPISNYGMNAGVFGLTIPSQSGRVYVLEYKSSLNDNIWTALPLVAGTGRPLTLTDPGSMNVPQRFYRVRRW